MAGASVWMDTAHSVGAEHVISGLDNRPIAFNKSGPELQLQALLGKLVIRVA